MSAPDPGAGYTVKEVLSQVSGKIDSLATQLATFTTTTAVDYTRLSERVAVIEKTGDRRWSLVGAWIGSAVSLVIAVAGFLVRV